MVWRYSHEFGCFLKYGEPAFFIGHQNGQKTGKSGSCFIGWKAGRYWVSVSRVHVCKRGLGVIKMTIAWQFIAAGMGKTANHFVKDRIVLPPVKTVTAYKDLHSPSIAFYHQTIHSSNQTMASRCAAMTAYHQTMPTRYASLTACMLTRPFDNGTMATH